MKEHIAYTAFLGSRILVQGSLEQVLREVKAQYDREEPGRVLVFEDRTGRQVDFNLSGTLEDVYDRAIPKHKHTGPGRPKLGVVCREVSLLPRHWDWLEQQPNGASAALRRLVEEARKRDPEKENLRLAVEAAHRFMTAMAGNRPWFEEACRALFAHDFERLEHHVQRWPAEIRDFLLRIVRNPSAISEA